MFYGGNYASIIQKGVDARLQSNLDLALLDRED